MKTKHVSQITTACLVVIAFAVTGCITDIGTTDSSVGSSSNLPPPDFTVPPAPAPAPAPTPQPPNDVSTLSGGFKITSANPTNSATVTLEMSGPSWPWMKIGYSPSCFDGQFEVFSRTKTIQLPTDKLNREVTISVMFDDGDANSSLCYKATLVHDNQGPTIVLKRYPAPSIKEGDAPEVEYMISDLLGVQSATCSLNGVGKACPTTGSNTITMTPLPEGSYNFVIHAVDVLGNESEASVPWEVVSTTRRLAQSFEVKNQNKVDILMIVDNSGSMEYEQQNMAARTSNLLSVIRGLDWRLAVTTTDPRSNAIGGDGQLLRINNTPAGTYVLTSDMPEAQAQANLASTLQRPETGSGSEQAIYATYRALERAQAGQTPNKDLIRPEAQFAAVVISDEDESANGPKNDPHNLIQYISDTFGGQKNFSFHSIITKPGDVGCISTYGATYGDRYNALSDLTGGVIGSVCEQDYAQQIVGIANGIRNLLKTMTLSCQPIVEKGITVLKDGQPYTASYTVEGFNLRFDTELSAGSYTVNYSCLK